MCGPRADGTYRYCKSRQPGARSAEKKQRRTAVEKTAQDISSYLPSKGSARRRATLPKELVGATRRWQEAMGPEEEAEVRNYTIGVDEQVNGYLREHSGWLDDDADDIAVEHDVFDEDGERNWETYDRSMTQTVKMMDAALAKAPRTEEPIVLYRGLYCPDDASSVEDWAEKTFPEGSNVVMPSYSSTSIDPTTAAGFTGTRGVVLEIVSTQGAYLDEFSAFGGGFDDEHDLGEQEVLLARNSRFKVVGHDYAPVEMGGADFGETYERDVHIIRLAEVTN